MYIYHFTSAESFSQILKNGTLKFSNSCELDDPFERRPYSDIIGLAGGSRPSDAVWGSFFSNLTSYCNFSKVLCFSVEKNGVNPLTDLKMWSHYGRWHRGICMTFDKAKMKSSLENLYSNMLFSGEVGYSDLIDRVLRFQTHDFPDADIEAEIVMKAFISLRFFQKHSRYLGENEYRFVKLDKLSTTLFCDIRDSLLHVTFGFNIDTKQEIRFQKKLEKRKIPFGKMDLVQNEFMEREI